ncbi:MAG: hypothetical protein IJE59_01750 [Clostridia bacterium]|nr:hypothetical protein [Clostridia bacterium]
MNQILLTENYKSNNKNKSSNKNNSNDTKKIIIFFSIFILVFAVAIIGLYGYKIYSNSNKEETVIAKPQLSLEETEDFVTIIANAEAGISKIIYTWNDEEPTEVDMNGRTSHEEQMDIPVGQNKLNVKVIDAINQEIETTKEFTKISTEKPTIETEIGEDAKLKITATDETAIKYITYKWNDEESTKVDAQTETDTLIEVKIDVKRGKNTLEVVAVDSDGNEEKISKIFNGVNKPIIKVTKKDNELYMKITHDMGFEKVEFSINGQIYKYNKEYAGYDENNKELEYKFDLKEGENTVIILAVSTEGTEEIYRGKCNYSPEQ